MVTPYDGTLDRRSVVARLLRDRDGVLVVTGLGSPSYDTYAAGDHEGNYYLWGAMGAAALVGLGLAQAQTDRTVLVVTGDGEQLMGLGGLATIAVAAPRNLVIVVLDNGRYGETGMQWSHTGFGLDLAAVARSAGFAEARTIVDEAQVEAVAQSIRGPASGPRLYAVKVRAESLPRSLPPRDAVHGKNRLRAYLGFQVS
jgi:thiamine pyrophosphate-dependent acetolactate synthase large subunit-like protein